ncbi:MAG: hypothetical protein N2A99_06420 [Carnobacterium alterfunditum]
MASYAMPIIQYGIFFILLLMALNLFIKALWSTDERLYFKRRFVNQLKSQRDKFVKTDIESVTVQLFRAAGMPKMSDSKWLFIRMILILITVTYLVIEGNLIGAFTSIIIIYLVTEVKYNFSPVNLFLKKRASSIQQKKEIELFTLFALLKTDLTASNSDQVNVYHLINETTSYFKEINYVLVKFLTLWKKSPEVAGAVFQKELSSETAGFIGDVLSKLHNMDRKDALALLSEQGEVFTYKRAELAVQKEEKTRYIFFMLFFIASFFGIAWFLYFTYSMISQNMTM